MSITSPSSSEGASGGACGIAGRSVSSESVSVSGPAPRQAIHKVKKPRRHKSRAFEAHARSFMARTVGASEICGVSTERQGSLSLSLSSYTNLYTCLPIYVRYHTSNFLSFCPILSICLSGWLAGWLTVWLSGCPSLSVEIDGPRASERERERQRKRQR